MYVCTEHLRIFECVCWTVLVYCMCACFICVCSWSLCLIWLMEVAVEAALSWLKLQAAPGFSLTYDNTPVILIREPRSTFVADGCSRFFLAFFFLNCLTSLLASSISFCFSLYFSLIREHTPSNLHHLESPADSVPKLTIADGGWCMCVFPRLYWMQQLKYIIGSVFSNPPGPRLMGFQLFELKMLRLCMDYKCGCHSKRANRMCYHTTYALWIESFAGCQKCDLSFWSVARFISQ